MFLWLIRQYIQYNISRKHKDKCSPLNSARIDIADLKANQSNKIDIPDEVDGCDYVQLVNGRFQCGNGEVKVRYVQPFFYRVLLAWAFVELIILSFILLESNDDGGFPSNFLGVQCINNRCGSVIKRMISYKLISAVLLAIGGFKVRRGRFFSRN